MQKIMSVIVAVFAACVVNGAARAADPASVGKPAPAFTLPDQDGKTVSLGDSAGKIVVLEWINPECPFVQRHYRLGTMKSVAQKYADKDVVWLAINSTHHASADDNKKWKAENSLPYAILMDKSGDVGHAYGATNTPHMYIIDKTGTLVYAGGIDSQPTDHGDIASDTVNYVDKALGELTGGQSVSVAESKPYGCSVKYDK